MPAESIGVVDQLNRILEFGRIVQLFDKREIYFAEITGDWIDAGSGASGLKANTWNELSKHNSRLPLSGLTTDVHEQHHLCNRRRTLLPLGRRHP